MIFHQFYLNCLAQASYLIGDEETHTAAIVDPRRDVQVYVDEAERHGLRIRMCFSRTSMLISSPDIWS